MNDSTSLQKDTALICDTLEHLRILTHDAKKLRDKAESLVDQMGAHMTDPLSKPTSLVTKDAEDVMTEIVEEAAEAEKQFLLHSGVPEVREWNFRVAASSLMACSTMPDALKTVMKVLRAEGSTSKKLSDNDSLIFPPVTLYMSEDTCLKAKFVHLDNPLSFIHNCDAEYAVVRSCNLISEAIASYRWRLIGSSMHRTNPQSMLLHKHQSLPLARTASGASAIAPRPRVPKLQEFYSLFTISRVLLSCNYLIVSSPTTFENINFKCRVVVFPVSDISGNSLDCRSVTFINCSFNRIAGESDMDSIDRYVKTLKKQVFKTERERKDFEMKLNAFQSYKFHSGGQAGTLMRIGRTQVHVLPGAVAVFKGCLFGGNDAPCLTCEQGSSVVVDGCVFRKNGVAYSVNTPDTLPKTAAVVIRGLADCILKRSLFFVCNCGVVSLGREFAPQLSGASSTYLEKDVIRATMKFDTLHPFHKIFMERFYENAHQMFELTTRIKRLAEGTSNGSDGDVYHSTGNPAHDSDQLAHGNHQYGCPEPKLKGAKFVMNCAFSHCNVGISIMGDAAGITLADLDLFNKALALSMAGASSASVDLIRKTLPHKESHGVVPLFSYKLYMGIQAIGSVITAYRLRFSPPTLCCLSIKRSQFRLESIECLCESMPQTLSKAEVSRCAMTKLDGCDRAFKSTSKDTSCDTAQSLTDKQSNNCTGRKRQCEMAPGGVGELSSISIASSMEKPVSMNQDSQQLGSYSSRELKGIGQANIDSGFAPQDALTSEITRILAECGDAHIDILTVAQVPDRVMRDIVRVSRSSDIAKARKIARTRKAFGITRRFFAQSLDIQLNDTGGIADVTKWQGRNETFVSNDSSCLSFVDSFGLLTGVILHSKHSECAVKLSNSNIICSNSDIYSCDNGFLAEKSLLLLTNTRARNQSRSSIVAHSSEIYTTDNCFFDSAGVIGLNVVDSRLFLHLTNICSVGTAIHASGDSAVEAVETSITNVGRALNIDSDIKCTLTNVSISETRET